MCPNSVCINFLTKGPNLLINVHQLKHFNTVDKAVRQTLHWIKKPQFKSWGRKEKWTTEMQ